MLAVIVEQIAWSRRTFGAGPRLKGNTAHILKELLEHREEPSVEEAVDIAMLGMDGLWRQVALLHPDASDEEIAEVIHVAYGCKLAKNMARPFTMTPPDVPSEGRPGKWKPTDAVFDVLTERRRQVEGEGWTVEHDDAHDKGQIASAAARYALVAGGWSENFTQGMWPWAFAWWKPTTARRMLVKAAALIIAEIERLDRRAAKHGARDQ